MTTDTAAPPPAPKGVFEKAVYTNEMSLDDAKVLVPYGELVERDGISYWCGRMTAFGDYFASWVKIPLVPVTPDFE